MQEGKREFGIDPFFDGLDPVNQQTRSTHWYKKLIESISKAAAVRAINAGLPIAEHAPYFDRITIAEVCEMYYASGTVKASLK